MLWGLSHASLLRCLGLCISYQRLKCWGSQSPICLLHPLLSELIASAPGTPVSMEIGIFQFWVTT